jgi:hypothetical protein
VSKDKEKKMKRPSEKRSAYDSIRIKNPGESDNKHLSMNILDLRRSESRNSIIKLSSGYDTVRIKNPGESDSKHHGGDLRDKFRKTKSLLKLDVFGEDKPRLSSESLPAQLPESTKSSKSDKSEKPEKNKDKENKESREKKLWRRATNLATSVQEPKRSSVALTESTCDEDTPLCTQRFFPNNGSDSPNKELVPLTEVCTPESAQTASSELSSPNSPVADHPFYKGLPSLVSQADMENKTYEKIEHEKHNHYPELGNKTIQKTLKSLNSPLEIAKKLLLKVKKLFLDVAKKLTSLLNNPPYLPLLKNLK